ncbi:hypothetical protein DBY65_005130 [Pseudomonas sp. RIT412]|nr:hypothetical protein DBP26_005535 [Pseudomonas sp. RIT 409]RAU55307.1 hypothetical protein DBY65_005130 [Pseudomonas sp. RIT 412]
MGFGYVTSLEAMLFGLVKIPPRLFRIYAAKLMFHIALYLDQGYAVKLRMSAFEGMFYGLAMRSITGTGRCIDFVGYTPYALRRCMKLNVINNDQSLRLKRGQDGVFEISRKEETLKSVVINL